MTAPTKDAYPLSPMQQGMLFHSVSAPASDVYVQQLSCRFRGDLDVDAFRTAWEELIRRHAVLRTAFAWHGLPEPLQVVGERVRVPLEVIDTPVDLDAVVRDERVKGFDLGRAPLMRLRLIRLASDAWQFVWTWHHAILDAWSVPILMEELFAAYEGQPLEPVRPYKDFVAWQRARSRGDAETFWRKYLDGFVEPTPLGIEEETGETGYGLEFLAVPDDEVEALRSAAKRARLTPNTFVQAAWAILLSRYSGRDEVLFGTAVAGRPPELAGVEKMVGLLINTLPVRIHVDPERRIGAWLDQLQQHQAETRRYEQTPLADVQGWSAVPRGTQLFESLLVFENVPLDLERFRRGRLTLEHFEFVERANFPLTVMMEIRAQSRLGVGWDLSRFDRPSMRRLLGHLRTLLREMAADLDRTIGELDCLTPGERHELLDVWSAGPHPNVPTTELPITRLFEAQVERTPDAPAATFGGSGDDVTLTYRELNAHANRVAHWLQANGVEHGDRVVICMDASLERLAAILGTMKAGAAYVPVDHATPPARLRDVMADSGAKVLLDETWTLPHGDDANLAAAPDAGALAYIIYTSGSTGRPKGVAITHRSLHHLVRAQIDAFEIDARSHVLQFASLSFDASVSEIFTALLAGARLYLAPRRVLVPSRELMQLMERWAISVVTLPPSVLSRLPVGELHALKTLVSAGEACSADLVARWSPGRRFLNAYGPTEVTVCATIGEAANDGRKPSIGRAMGDARVYVLDAKLRPVPIGVTGELFVGGPGVAAGYWNRPELTAASFLVIPSEVEGSGREGRPAHATHPDPSTSLGMTQRLYRTGDLVRFRTDGQLEFIGRRDAQVKVRGFRVEPGEIEAVLRGDPSIGEAAVIADDSRLVAYVVPRKTKTEWWPSIAEYFVYDELAYHAMTSDERRNDSYRAAFAQTVRDKVVVEVGTGPEALLSRFCVEAGARKVYALELLPESYRKAKARVSELGLDDRIEVILGDATKIELPELADVCVSEIVGSIGGSEGAAAIMNGVRRLLREDAAIVPIRSRTMYAPVELPAELLSDLAFGELPARYVERIFEQVGQPFDLRLCIRGLDRSHLLAEPRVFEDLDYRGVVDPEVRHRSRFEIQRDGRIDGLLVWLTLETGGGATIDILEHEHCWLPVFFPLFDGRPEVRAGDVIDALSGAILTGDAPHPDYFVEGSLVRNGRSSANAPRNSEEPEELRGTAVSDTLRFRHDAPRHGRELGATPFYRRMFEGGAIPRLAKKTFDASVVKQRLRELLPEHMVPEAFVQLDELPLLPSGKLDRRGLPTAAAPAPARAVVPPRNQAEKLVAGIWQQLLGLGDSVVGHDTNFFDHGGHSLLLLRVQDRIREDAGIDIPIADLFQYPTVESLARRLTIKEPAVADRGTSRAAARQQALGRMANRRQSLAGDESS
jgi:amino acid adenylation domain-containing protein